MEPEDLRTLCEAITQLNEVTATLLKLGHKYAGLTADILRAKGEPATIGDQIGRSAKEHEHGCDRQNIE